jgi:hypothetical protein
MATQDNLGLFKELSYTTQENEGSDFCSSSNTGIVLFCGDGTV